MENYDVKQLTGKECDNGKQEKTLIDYLEIELAIHKLSVKYRKIIRMIYNGFTYREIIKKLHLTNNEIKRAKKAIRDIIK